MSTRLKTELFLIGQPRQDFPPGQLPTYRDVLSVMIGTKKEKGKMYPIDKIAGCSQMKGSKELSCFETGGCLTGEKPCVVAAVKQSWSEAGLSVVSGAAVKRRLTDEYAKYSILAKDKFKSGPAVSKKREAFDTRLNSLFDISAASVVSDVSMDRLRNDADKEEDIAFLEDQRGPRRMFYTTKDDKYAGKVAARTDRLDRIEKFKEKQNISALKAEPAAVSDISDEDEEESENEENYSPDISPVKKLRKVDKSVVLLEVPRNILAKVSEDATRLDCSPNQLSAIVGSLIAKSGGDVDKFALSESTAKRATKKVEAEIASKAKEQFREQCRAGHKFIIHFDGKIVPELGTSKAVKSKEDRLAVLAMCGQDEHLMGIVAMDHGTGEAQAKAVFSLLQDFGAVEYESVIGLSYDTTASNTAHNKGAVARLERMLGRSLLKLPCRRHMIELHVKHVSKVVSQRETTGPNDVLFVKFRKNWDNLDKSIDQLSKFHWGESEAKDTKAEEVLGRALDWVASNSFERGDYHYLSKLLVVYLSKDTVPFTFRFGKPHNLNPARFLQKSIFYIEMSLLIDRLGQLFNAVEILEIKRMGEFCCLFYAPWFLRCPIAAASPYSDLKAIEEMRVFRESIEEEANACLASWERHLDFLSPALVVFSLTDKSTPTAEKEAMANAMLAFLAEHDIDDKFPPIKSGRIVVPGPDFCCDKDGKFWPDNTTPSLASFIGMESFLVFHYLDLLDFDGLAWLSSPVDTWTESAEYIKLEAFISSLSVVNDSAERTVKLMQDVMKDGMRDEVSLQHKFVAVKESRKRLPSNRKGVILKSSFKS